MQGLLRDVGARRKGEKAAAEAIRWLCASGILENMYDPMTRTGEVKKPRRDPNRMAARERFGRGRPESHEGGRDAQPSTSRSYWWRVFRVVPLAKVLRVSGAMQHGAYAHFVEVPQALASLSAWAARQGLISRRRGSKGARPGSVQWAFMHTGPP
jgi:hypothetical protein